MRKFGHANSYDKLKAITRGKGISETDIKSFIESVDLPAADKQRLLPLPVLNSRVQLLAA